MITIQSMHTKRKINRLTLGLLMLLSIFTALGSIGLSANQPQKVSTELPLTTGQKFISRSCDYYGFKFSSNNVTKTFQLQKQQKYALIRFNKLLLIQFNYQFRRFLEIKPGVLRNNSSLLVPKSQYEPLSA